MPREIQNGSAKDTAPFGTHTGYYDTACIGAAHPLKIRQDGFLVWALKLGMTSQREHDTTIIFKLRQSKVMKCDMTVQCFCRDLSNMPTIGWLI